MEPLEETKHYERVRRSATQLTQFTTIDWVVDGRRERVKIMRHQEPVSYTHLTLPTICSV